MKRRKILSLLLALVIIVTMLPLGTFAEEVEKKAEDTVVTEVEKEKPAPKEEAVEETEVKEEAPVVEEKVDASAPEAPKMVPMGQPKSGGYTAIFSLNGGKGTTPEAIKDLKKGDPVTLPPLTGITRDGFTALGWATKADATAKEDTIVMPESNLTIYVVWKENPKHTVTFDVQGAKEAAPAAQEVAEGTDITLPSISGYSKDGYKALGWAKDKSATKPDATPIKMENADLTLYLIWEKNKVLTFYKDSTKSEKVEESYQKGASVDLKGDRGFKKDGFLFKGWSEASNGTSPLASYVMPDKDSELYGIWVKLFTLTLDANGGTVSPDKKEFEKATEVDLTAIVATKTGHTFKGWTTTKDDDTTKVDKITVSEDKTVFALWEKTGHDLKFDSDGGTAIPTKSYNKDDKVTLPTAEECTKAGAVLKGWVDKADPKTADGKDKFVTSPFTMPDKDVELKAIWALAYELKFDANGKTAEVPKAKNYLEETSITLPTAIVGEESGKTYYLKGWSETATGTQPIASPFKMPNKNVTLYAIWEEGVKITFDLKGGKEGPKDLGVPKNSTVELEGLKKPTKDNYYFVGWSLKSDGGLSDVVTKVDVKDKDIKLYAVWTQNRLSFLDVRVYYDYITGSVWDKDYKLVPNAIVTLKNSSGVILTTTTNSDGSFSFYIGDKAGNHCYDGYYHGSYYGYKNYVEQLTGTGSHGYTTAYNYVWAIDDYGNILDSTRASSSGYYTLSWTGVKHARIYVSPTGYSYYGGYYYGNCGKGDNTWVLANFKELRATKAGYIDATTSINSKVVTFYGSFKDGCYCSPYYPSNPGVSITNYAKYPTISSAEPGSSTVKGKAGTYATVTVYDNYGNKLGSSTADRDGNFTIYTNRTLKEGEVIKLVASESYKKDSSNVYTVRGKQKSQVELYRMSYIAGYPNGSFKPYNNLTRAEAAAMFARLLNGSSNFNLSKTTKFKDANNAWYSEAINYITAKGLISGYSDGTFKPNQKITRAEFAQMISGYVSAGYPGSNKFKDVEGHWANEAIQKVYGKKIVAGYPDGTFKPNQDITRAEAVTVLNSVFGRKSNGKSFANIGSYKLKSFTDVRPSDWFYAEVMDAANYHESYRGTDGYEIWVK